MSFHQQVHLAGHDLLGHYPPAMPGGFRADQVLTPGPNPAGQNRAAASRAPHDVIPKVADATGQNLHVPGHTSDHTHGHCLTTRFPSPAA